MTTGGIGYHLWWGLEGEDYSIKYFKAQEWQFFKRAIAQSGSAPGLGPWVQEVYQFKSDLLENLCSLKIKWSSGGMGSHSRLHK